MLYFLASESGLSFSADGVCAADRVWRCSSADMLPCVFSDGGDSTGIQFRHHGLADLCRPMHYWVRPVKFSVWACVASVLLRL